MTTASLHRIDLSRLGRYQLLEPIGGGATSVVYAAHDDAMDRPVAVKVILAEMADDREARERFYREAQITHQLLHRNIVTVLDITEEVGRPYIVMELLRGLPLGDYLQQEPPPALAIRLSLIVQLYQGLAAAHEIGVVHRDIKPGNLFVQFDGCLKILDFGLARLQASTLTASGQVLGTPDFMAPEQALGEKVDARSDIFSAAAVAYLILTGRAPFTGPDLRQTLDRLLNQDPEPIDSDQAPAAVIDVIGRALTKRPADRYQTCADVLAALEAARP